MKIETIIVKSDPRTRWQKFYDWASNPPWWYLLLWALIMIWGIRYQAEQIRESKVVPEAHAFADPCGLEVVICPGEIHNVSTVAYEVEKIIKVIAILETNYGKTGVGKSRNNLTGLRNNLGYLSFSTQEDSIAFSIRLWREHYGGLPIDQALAKWKTGNKNDRSEATNRYIANFHYLYNK